MLIDDPQLFPIYESLNSSNNQTSSIETDNPTCEMNSPSPRNKQNHISQ